MTIAHYKALGKGKERGSGRELLYSSLQVKSNCEAKSFGIKWMDNSATTLRVAMERATHSIYHYEALPVVV